MECFSCDRYKKNFILTLIIILILILSTLTLSFFAQKYNTDDNLHNDNFVEVTDDMINNMTIKKGPLDPKIDKKKNNSSKFTYSINSNIVFKNSKSLGSLKIENPSTNKYSLKVEIRIKDSDKIIYISPILHPDYHIKEDYLLSKLKKGSYDAVATIYIFDDNNEEIGQQDKDVKIHIKQTK